MLHALRSENKNNASRTRNVHEPRREFQPPVGIFSRSSLSESASSPRSPGPWPRLQSTYGNQAVLRMLSDSNRIQRKCAGCESGASTCPGCAAEEKSYQRRLTTVEKVASLRRNISDGGLPTGAGNVAPTPLSKGADGVGTGAPTPLNKDGGTGAPTPTEKDAGTTTCPTQTVTMSGAMCGAEYGAIGRYCYSGANRWWFKERVTMGSPNTCAPGATIDQTTTPFQASGNCVSDRITNLNGPPSRHAPCRVVTNQTVFTGPTQATVEQCQYSNAQVVEVTGTPTTGGQVITTSAGVSTSCNWTP